MKKIITHLILTILLIGALTFPYFVFATPNPLKSMNTVAQNGGYSETISETTFASSLGRIIQAFLGFLGIIFIILTIWAGYNWMTASGNEEKVSKAKTTLTRAIIGLIIILSANAIWAFIFHNAF